MREIESSPTALVPPPVAVGYRLSPQQRRLCGLLAAGPLPAARLEIAVGGEVAPPRLAAACLTVARRHEVLRTVFAWIPGVELPLQQVLDAPAIHFLGALAEAPGEAGTNEGALDAPFELASGPLVRAWLGPLLDGRRRLVITLPALLSDAPGLVLLARELAAAYAGGSEVSDDTGEETIQYAQIAELLDEFLSGEDGAEGRAFWQPRAGRGFAELRLPPAPAVGPARSHRDLPSDIAAGLVAAVAEAAPRAREHGLSPLALAVLTGWLTLLARTTEEPVALGVEASGRDLEVLAASLGPLARWLPLAAELAASEGFAAAAARVAAAWAEAHAWQDSYAPATAESAALWSAAFRAVDLGGSFAAGGVEFRATAAGSPSDRARLELTLVESAEGALLELASSAGVASPGQLAALVEQLVTLLTAAALAPRSPLGALPLLGPAARRELLLGGCGAVRPTAADQLVPVQLLRTAVAAPERIAVASGDEVLSFGELAARSGRLAAQLRALGVGPETVVAVLLERSPEAVVAVWAILLAGGVFLPLDLSLPEARLAWMTSEAKAQLAISRRGARELLPAGLPVVDLDADAAAIAARVPLAAPPGLRPENLAYVLYTSGSTGRPKAAMIAHRNLAHLGEALELAVYRGSGLARLALNAPLVFDASVKQWVQLAWGRTLDIVPEEVRPDGERLLAHLARRGVELLDLTPTQLRALVAAGLGAAAGRQLWPRALLVGGEAIAPDLWTALGGDEARRTLNIYGPTETTVDATVGTVAAGTAPGIGRPLANVQVHLLDRRGELVPPGVAGELGIAGDGVGRGYLGRPALTAERFVPDPGAGLTAAPGARLYRSGDRARWRPLASGPAELEFLGRRDHQVKVRGYRIELGEIESELVGLPGVAQAVAAVHRGDGGDTLVAYVVPASGEGEPAALIAGWRARLREALPEAMVPGHFVLLRSLPTNRSGKLDRLALPDPELAAAAGEAPYREPRNEIEQQVAAIWQRALGVERVGLDDNFFDLGGHSLLMVRVHEELTAAFGAGLTMLEMFRYPTVAALATRLAPAEKPPAGPPPAGTAAPEASPAAAASAVQERARLQAQAAERQRQAARARRGPTTETPG